MTAAPIICRVVDAGARYGLHPTWAPLEAVATVDMFETDGDEVARLRDKYKDRANITVHHQALFSEATTLTFNVRQHHALNSMYEVNRQLLDREAYMVSEFTGTGSYDVEAETLDRKFGDDPVHFLKLDVEGAELEVLNGGASVLGRSVLGVRCEVTFAPFFHGAPGFGDIHQYMLDHGFELLNLDYDGRGAAKGPFTQPNRYGKLLSSDAVWTLPPEAVLQRSSETLLGDVVRLATFYMMNGATDAAVDLLQRGVREAGLSFDDCWEDPLFLFLHKRVAFLFKDVGYLPSLSAETVAEAYAEIFGRAFPRLHEFYQSPYLA